MWQERVNSALRSTVGYELRRVRKHGGPGQRGVRPGAARADRQAANGAPSGQPAKPARQKKGRSGPPIPDHVDPAAREILQRVRPRTMTSWAKLHGLVLGVRYVCEHGIKGDIVECGVWRGGSMQAIAYTLQEQGDTSRELHLYDTFEGMSEPTEHDRRYDGSSAAELLATLDRDHSVWAIADLPDVQKGMAETGYPAERIHYHVGKVEDTIPGEGADAAPERISILRLDTDWYESTKHELDHLYDRLVPGGVLIIDDYGHWEGSRKATDDFLARTGEKLLLVPMNTGRIAVKPFA